MNTFHEPCPICKGQGFNAITETILHCRRCRIIYNTAWFPLSYSKDYFIEEYASQYGRTYIDDFNNIYNLSCSRLDKIFKHIKLKPELSILDIGSAAGFFLKAAQDRGIKNLTGIEISSFASSYCIENFKINVINTPFDLAETDAKFSIITAWFFLEHSPDPAVYLKKISSLLEDGGILAMALPSWFGPLFYFQRDQWIATRPADHRIDVSPGSVKKMLKYAGFETLEINRCGYHPERIFNKGTFLYRLFEPVYREFTTITSFSDTIEVYARKKLK
jgi:SAM-dependent methyltransferase